MKKTQIYFFLEELNSINISILKKLKNVSIIYRNYSKNNYIARAFELKKFSKRFGHDLYVSNDLRLARSIEANLYIPNFNKRLRYIITPSNKKIKVIGSAHNHVEIYRKFFQGCSGIFLSPIFKTTSHPRSEPLGISRFNFLKKHFSTKLELYALGGINENNLKKIYNSNIFAFGLKSFLDKVQCQKTLSFLNLIARSNVIS